MGGVSFLVEAQSIPGIPANVLNNITWSLFNFVLLYVVQGVDRWHHSKTCWQNCFIDN